MYNYYLKLLDYPNRPKFLDKYLKSPSLVRLKKVGYFCGMDYASKNIYNFKEKITRYDHSLNVALITYKLTKNKSQTISALFHDIATPCFSHVIDYMNKDYEFQESTEEYTEKIINNDKYLLDCLKEDKIKVEDIINFKKYTVVDNNRPKLCADRLDGVILNGAFWTNSMTKKDIKEIINDICLFKNEDSEDEIGFKTIKIAKKVLETSKVADIYCHSYEDNYMMELLAEITRLSIDKKYITYDELYIYNEEKLFNLLNDKKDLELKKLLNKFKTIKKEEIPKLRMCLIKVRDLNPLVNGIRIK